MKYVIYTADVQPITIVDVDIDLINRLRRVGANVISFYVPPDLDCLPMLESDVDYNKITVQIVDLKIEMWRRGPHEGVMLFADSCESEIKALALQPAFLPGQQKTINGYEQHISMLERLISGALGGM